MSAKKMSKDLLIKDKKMSYRLLTGIDDSNFCKRVSEALIEGYELYGSPAITFNGKNNIVAQAVILRDSKKVK